MLTPKTPIWNRTSNKGLVIFNQAVGGGREVRGVTVNLNAPKF